MTPAEIVRALKTTFAGVTLPRQAEEWLCDQIRAAVKAGERDGAIEEGLACLQIAQDDYDEILACVYDDVPADQRGHYDDVINAEVATASRIVDEIRTRLFRYGVAGEMRQNIARVNP